MYQDSVYATTVYNSNIHLSENYGYRVPIFNIFEIENEYNGLPVNPPVYTILSVQVHCIFCVDLFKM